MVPLPSSLELGGNAGQDGGRKVSHVLQLGVMIVELHLDWGASNLFEFLSLPLLLREGWVRAGQGVASLELGSDSGKPQGAGEKDAAAPAGAGETAPNDEVRLHASNPPDLHCAHQVKGTQPGLPFKHLAGFLGPRAGLPSFPLPLLPPPWDFGFLWRWPSRVRFNVLTVVMMYGAF